MREWWSKIERMLSRRRGLEDDLREEMRAHLEFLVDENLAHGMAPGEARTAARRSFGNQTATCERAHEAWQFPTLETVLMDIRYGLRALRKSPAVSLAIILTLALGLGATTAIFSVVYAVLMRPLPYPDGERLVWLAESTPKASGISVTWMNLQHWRTGNGTFEDMAGLLQARLTMTGRGEAMQLNAAVVTTPFFALTGSSPLLGRLFGEADDHPGAEPVVVLTYEFWANTLGADARVLGSTLALNGTAREVIGVLWLGLVFFSGRLDCYLPLGHWVGAAVNRSQHASIRGLGLLKPGVTAAAARADLDSIMQRLALDDPGPEDDHRALARYLTEHRTGGIRQTLLVLMGAVGLVLIIACANVASLLLVRNTARARELAIRTAIGAGRGRLARQLLTENLVIAALGGGFGVLMAALCLRTLVLAGPPNIPRLSEATLDVPVLLFATAITVMVGLLAGMAPAFPARRVDLTVALKDGSQRSGGGRRGHSLRGAFVVAEIAITLILTFASALLLRSLIAAQSTDPGFTAGHLLALEVNLPSSQYKTGEQVEQFYDGLTEDLRREAGVVGVGAVRCPPLAGSCWDYWYSIPGKPSPAPGDVPLTLFNIVDGSYFETMQMRLVAGRGFTASDRKGGPLIAIINDEIARRWWTPPETAVGGQIKFGGPHQEGATYEIVGVVASVNQMGLDQPRAPEVYFSFSQQPSTAMTVMIRTSMDPARLIPAVRRHVASLSRTVPIPAPEVFERRLGATLARRRFSAMSLGAFAALAMTLAAVGIYGVLNYWVNVRQKEIAIRLALGAQRWWIAGWAGGQVLRLAAAGIALGMFGGWGVSRWLTNLVFGISAQNAAMMIAAGVSVMAVAGLAAGAPLWRATRVDAVGNLHDT